MRLGLDTKDLGTANAINELAPKAAINTGFLEIVAEIAAVLLGFSAVVSSLRQEADAEFDSSKRFASRGS